MEPFSTTPGVDIEPATPLGVTVTVTFTVVGLASLPSLPTVNDGLQTVLLIVGLIMALLKLSDELRRRRGRSAA